MPSIIYALRSWSSHRLSTRILPTILMIQVPLLITFSYSIFTLFLFGKNEKSKTLLRKREKELGQNMIERCLTSSSRVNFTRKLLIPYFATTYVIRSPKTWPTFQRNRIGKPTRFNDHSLAKLLTSIFLVSECLDLFCDSRSCLDDRRNELPPKVERKG